MALVFQYGSNMSIARLNDKIRLNGEAKVVCVAKTIEKFEFEFTVWSKTNECAAANIAHSEQGRNIYGVVYEIPDYLISRETAKTRNAKSLDAIEGEGTNYERKEIQLEKMDDGSKLIAKTYLVKNPKPDLRTSKEYVNHILEGLKDNDIPREYRDYVYSRIIKNNPELKSAV